MYIMKKRYNVDDKVNRASERSKVLYKFIDQIQFNNMLWIYNNNNNNDGIKKIVRKKENLHKL